MSNPYEAPSTAHLVGSGHESRERLRAVASRQRFVQFAVLFNIFATIGFNVLPQIVVPTVLVLVGMYALVFLVLALQVTAVVRLASILQGTGAAILYGLLMFLPCISLIALLVINQQATRLLQQNGIRVGLMGADPSSI